MSLYAPPGSGQVLGCAERYTAVIRDRGSGPVRAVLDTVTDVQWDRRIDEPSEGTVNVKTRGLGRDCCQFLSKVRAWAYEVGIYRVMDRGAMQLVWEGPLMNPEESLQRGVLKLVAFDVLEWLKVRVNHTDWAFPAPGLDAATMVAYMIADGFLPDDPNVVRHMIVAKSADMVARDDPAESTIVWKAAAELMKTLVDVTTVGRRIIVMPEANAPWTTVLNFGPDDFLGDVVQGHDGTEYANRVIVQGKGVQRAARRLASGLIRPDDLDRPAASDSETDQFHGLVEQLLQLQDVTTDAEAYATARSVLQTSVMPGYVRAANGGQLSPRARVRLDQLVPGTQVDLMLPDDFCLDLPLNPLLQLSNLDVTWSAEEGEKVAVSIAAIARGGIAASA